jgi:hypothetical protein
VVIGDRNQGRIGKPPHNGRQIGSIETVVDRGEVRKAETDDHRQVDPIRVTVQDIKLLSTSRDGIELGSIRWKRLGPWPAQSYRLWTLSASGAI